MNTARLIARAALVGLTTSGAAHADVLRWGDFVGANADYFDVTETNNQTGRALLGVPSVSGDTLSTPNTNFVAEAIDVDVIMLDAQLEMEVRAHAGRLINSVTITESGSYSGDGADSFTSVSAFGSVDAGGGILSDSATREHDGFGSGNWSVSMTFDFDPAASVEILLRNNLFAEAGLDQSASIDKQTMMIEIGTVPVPAPGSLALLGIACLGARRRRARS